MPHVILNFLEGKPLPVYRNGSQIRAWLYVEDHARWLVEVVRKGTVGETFNIGGHNEKRNLEVVDARFLLDELVPLDANFWRTHSCKGLVTFVKDRLGHDHRYAIDASKIGRELDWVTHEIFETGLGKAFQWYLDNRQWWQHVLSGQYRLGRLGKII